MYMNKRERAREERERREGGGGREEGERRVEERDQEADLEVRDTPNTVSTFVENTDRGACWVIQALMVAEVPGTAYQ